MNKLKRRHSVARYLAAYVSTSGLTDMLADLQHGSFWFQGPYLRNVWALALWLGRKCTYAASVKINVILVRGIIFSGSKV